MAAHPKSVVAPARYPPIRDYAMIGDCHGGALVSRTGSIDWCCLERFDADPVFCRLLDADAGGYLSVEPTAPFEPHRHYLDDTNILLTRLQTAQGSVTLTDFMPVGRRPDNSVHDYVTLNAPGWLVRIVEVDAADMTVRIRYRPSVAFAARTPRLSLPQPGLVAEESGVCLHHTLGVFTVNADGVAELVLQVRAGMTFCLVVCTSPTVPDDLGSLSRDLLAVTRAYWREWSAYCRYRGRYHDAVARSALTVKMLTYAPSGAIAAAPTTSLPEEIGGERNWDYRYCWLRDSALALYALSALGYGGESRRFSEFLPRICAATVPELQAVYGLDGHCDLTEAELDHLEGYRASRPVRRGNAAFRQRQNDIYGELLDWAVLYHALGGTIDGDIERLLRSLADFVTAHWREPDHGLWETRAPPAHHVHSKIMSWVALDRAIALLGPQADWEAECGRIVEEVLARGVDPATGSLTRAYGATDPDASLLLSPTVAFPIDRAALAATVAGVERNLRHGDFVRRYMSEDGLKGGEGDFLICSFWLVDTLLHLDRQAEARQIFERLLACANDVGLYAEEIDPRDGTFLGNFPQAYTHLAQIASAVHLDLCARHGPQALAGTYADRARLAVTAVLGWRGWWAAFKATWRVGRLRSSRASVLSWS
jgi:GH15 family glucan-1,4-alpha-glucosidase